MKTSPWLLVPVTLLLAGCASETQAGAPVPTATVTATATATVTATATATVTATVKVTPEVVPEPERSAALLPRLELEVFEDGCGVIRSETPPGVDYQNLTWTFLDQDGFQVLGRNAEGETRYRFFSGGTYAVVLEAFVDGRYAPVSNRVTVHC